MSAPVAWKPGLGALELPPHRASSRPVEGGRSSPREGEASAEERVRREIAPHLPAVWRFVRRLGVPRDDVDDLVQEALLLVVRRLDDVRPGSERSFLFGSAYRLASDARRKGARRATIVCAEGTEHRDAPSLAKDVGAVLDERRALAEVDRILDAMSVELRAVFVLHELEERTMGEIAAALALPPGTVASRLRRARAEFTARVAARPAPEVLP